jgi:NAD(P)H dehydrogenase (quinone)
MEYQAMPKVLVLFYSRTGNTATLADAIAAGAASVRYAEVDVRRIADLAPENVIQANPDWVKSRAALAKKYRTFEQIDVDLLPNYDALILGSPTRYGVMSAELKNVLDQTGPLWQAGALVDKVGGAFTSVATPHGGHEMTLHSIMTPMMHHGMILAAPGYTDPVMFAAGSPYGATATTSGGAPTEMDLKVAQHQGVRVAKVAEWVRHAKSHEAGHAREHTHAH